MIRVVAPDGWVVPQLDFDPSSSQVSNESIGDLGGDFEDIEHLLAKPKQLPKTGSRKHSSQPKQRSNPSPAAPTRAGAATPRRSARPVTNRPPVQAAASPEPIIEGPVLPNDQWTSDGTRLRKRIVTAIVGVLGTLLLLAAIGAAIVFNLTKPPAPAEQAAAQFENGPDDEADNDDDGMLDEEDLIEVGPLAAMNKQPNPQPQADVGQAPPVIGENSQTAARPVGAVPPQVKIPNNRIDPSTAKEPRNNHSKLQELIAPGVGGVDAADQDPVKPNRQAPVAPPKLSIDKSPFAGGVPATNGVAISVEPAANQDRPANVGMVEAFESDLGDLAELLEESGTSILDFQDLTASIRTRQIVGIPNYIITKPEPQRLDLQKQLEMPIGGIKFDDAPLTRVLRNVSAISGVPITIDARSIADAGKPTNPVVSVMIADSTFGESLAQILTPLGLDSVPHAYGLTVGVFPSQSMSQMTFEIPGGAAIDDTGKNNLISTIQVLIEPESWARQENPATIEIKNNEILANCSENAHSQITTLLSKLSGALKLATQPDDADAVALTRSRWHSIKSGLSQNPALAHSVRKELGAFLDRLQTKTGTSVVVDWQHLSAEGWTPATIVPGNIQEDTVENTVGELARAMDLTFVAVDRETLMMTTFSQTARMVDLEVYPLPSLVPQRLSPQLLLELVSESLGAQLQSARVKYTYEPNYHCLIVTAPQQIQRQIEALVDRLETDLAVANRPRDVTQNSTE